MKIMQEVTVSNTMKKHFTIEKEISELSLENCTRIFQVTTLGSIDS